MSKRLPSIIASTALLCASTHIAHAQDVNSDATPPDAVAPAVKPPVGETGTSEAALGTKDTTGALDRTKTTTTWPNVPLLLTSVVVLGASYGASVIVAAESDRKADDKLNIPVAGPWIDLHDRDCGATPCAHKNWDKALLIGDGVLQGVGALGLVLSLVVPQSSTKNWYLVGNERFSVTPSFAFGTTSLTGVGSF